MLNLVRLWLNLEVSSTEKRSSWRLERLVPTCFLPFSDTNDIRAGARPLLATNQKQTRFLRSRPHHRQLHLLPHQQPVNTFVGAVRRLMRIDWCGLELGQWRLSHQPELNTRRPRCGFDAIHNCSHHCEPVPGPESCNRLLCIGSCHIEAESASLCSVGQ